MVARVNRNKEVFTQGIQCKAWKAHGENMKK